MRAFRICLLLSLWTSAVVMADGNPFGGFFTLGYGHGGDDLKNLTRQSDYDLQAGTGFLLSAGTVLTISPTVPHRFETQLGIGYLFQNKNDKKNEVYWQRIPLEVIHYYHNTARRFRLGGGVIYHFNNELTGKGKYSRVYAKVDDAWGAAVAAEKFFLRDEQWTIGLRYQWIKYRSASFSEDADGSSLLFTFSTLL